MEEAKRATKKILMLPWLAYGHISPFLELAKKLSQHNFHIYLCSSPVSLQSVRARLPEKLSSSIELVELNLQSFPDLPPHLHTTNGLPLHLIPILFQAFDSVVPQFSTILTDLNPDLLIFDVLQPRGAREIALSLNISVTTLHVVGAATSCKTVYDLYNQNTDRQFPFLEILKRDPWVSKKLNKSFQDPNVQIAYPRFIQWVKDLEFCSDVILVNSFAEIEGKYMDYISHLLKKKVIPVGPLLQELGSKDEESDDVLKWLDKKDPISTVYVSFGSEYYLSKKDREELAWGLEMSGVNFIWVVRFPKGEDVSVEDVLPNGYVKRVGERGLMINRWVPQMKILGHRNVSGFVCHCGWNSVMEGMVLGVPIIALPMHLEQPLNAKVAVAAGVSVVAERDDDGGIVREGVAKAIREVVFEKGGVELRRRASEICEGLKSKHGQGMQELVAEFDKLCEGKKLA